MFPRAGQPVGDFHKGVDHRVRTPQTASVWPLPPYRGRDGRLRGVARQTVAQPAATGKVTITRNGVG
jgi:hypothetical protein